jgi:hypothetical protein
VSGATRRGLIRTFFLFVLLRPGWLFISQGNCNCHIWAAADHARSFTETTGQMVPRAYGL